MNGSKKFFSDNTIYLLIIGISVLVIGTYNLKIGIAGFLIFLYMLYYNNKLKQKQQKTLQAYIESLSQNLDTATKRAIINIPFPMAITDDQGRINWYNSKFFELHQREYLLNKDICGLISGLDFPHIVEQDAVLYDNVGIGEEAFDVYCDRVQIEDGSTENIIVMIYLVKKTEFVKLRETYFNERIVVAVMEVDNYEEMQREIPDDKKPEMLAEIEKRINTWATSHEASIQKYSGGHYLLHFNYKSFSAAREKRFDILDSIREINSVAKLPVTLSMGVGVGGKTVSESHSFAKLALDLALGRGGDQAVIKDGEKLSYYGGKTKAVEKRTRVKARVISHALRQLILESENVLIMGHDIPDLDSVGAALGLYRCCIQLEKDARIVLNKENPGITNLMAELRAIPEYHKTFVNNTEALMQVGDQTLLIVVDTHRPSFTECKALTERVEKVVIVDHHRRAYEVIERAAITYIEPYASSTSELVTELAQYMFEKPRLTQIEAEALLAGIFIDTKNFSFQTGVRTFEAASFLRRMGADTTMTRQLFQDDMETFLARAEVVKQAIIYRDSIAISSIAYSTKGVALIAAQSADELLNIKGINASFVLSKVGEDIYISGRSLGNINVQVILEKLGGGGHLTVAGAQLQGETIEGAMEKVKAVIDEYLKEAEKA